VVKGKSPKELADMMGSFTMTEWKVMDSDILDWSVVETGDDYRVYYQENNLPWPLWHRTTVYVQYLIEEDGTYYWVGVSTTHPDKPDEPKKFVRATITISVYAFEPHSDGSKVTRLLHVNPQGNIPAGVVNSLSSALINIPKKLTTMASS